MTTAVPGWCAKASDALSNREIDRLAFFGEWYDAATGSLLNIGKYTSSDGKVLINPKLRDLRGTRLVSGGGPIPEVGTGGQFAYAFSFTPYGLRANPEEVQELFDEITESSFQQIGITRSWIGAGATCPKCLVTLRLEWNGGVYSCSQYMYRSSAANSDCRLDHRLSYVQMRTTTLMRIGRSVRGGRSCFSRYLTQAERGPRRGGPTAARGSVSVRFRCVGRPHVACCMQVFSQHACTELAFFSRL